MVNLVDRNALGAILRGRILRNHPPKGWFLHFSPIDVDPAVAALAAFNLVDEEEVLRKPEMIRVEVVRTTQLLRYRVFARYFDLDCPKEFRGEPVATEVVWDPDLIYALELGCWSVQEETEQLWHWVDGVEHDESAAGVKVFVFGRRKEAERVGLALCGFDGLSQAPRSEVDCARRF